MERPLAVGLAQVTGEPYESQRNLAVTLEAAERLLVAGAELVVLPELVVPGYVVDRKRLEPLAEPLDGPSVRAWTALAQGYGGWIAGGFCERDGEALFNTAVLIGPDGLALHYRKLHLFREEKHTFTPGNLGLPVVELPFGRVGMCICYDLRFVETVRALALQGAELICVATAWTAGFDEEKWNAQGLAPQAEGAILQANLDQVFIACASQAGSRGDLELLGSSILVDPRGKLIHGPMSGESDETAVAVIDLDQVREAHRRDPLITPRADRRTDVYGIALEERVL